MFRHVVVLRWADDAPPARRATAVEALRRLGAELADFAHMSVGTDAGLAEGNADIAVVVDVADRDAYARYAADPRHVAVIAEYLRPILAERVAVQYEY